MTRNAFEGYEVKPRLAANACEGGGAGGSPFILKTLGRNRMFGAGFAFAAPVVLVLFAGDGFAQAPVQAPASVNATPPSTKSPAAAAGTSDAGPPATGAPPNPGDSGGGHEATKSATPAVVIGPGLLEGISGKTVRSATGDEDMGRIVDVLVGADGQTRAAVIDFGGFLGVGSRKVAVGWKTLDFTGSIKNGSVKVLLTRDQVRQSPEYKTGEPVVILEGPGRAPASGASAGHAP